MQNPAASAALSSSKGSRPSSAAIFGEDGKLSSASAALSLKYARAQDLPSFPSSGGVQLSSAGAAASLASSNRRSFEHWKAEPIPAANRAALLAKDLKMNPLWQPEASSAGSRAAMMAAANPIQIEAMQPKGTGTNKSTASGAGYDTPENTHRRALMAANAASHNRRRSDSLPNQTTPKATDDALWAMKAATKSHRGAPSPASAPFASGDPGFEAARIQNIAKNNVNRQLYSSAPPVDLEVQEKKRQDTLRASAVAMAQQMYAMQQKAIEESAGKTDSQALAASRARSSTFTGSTGSAHDEATMVGSGFENLEEAARKLAQERLAKIHDEHAEYRSYYGQTSPPRSRLSMRLRRRGSSAADEDSDEEQSRKIRSQMSIFQSKLAEVDSKKRQQDRDALLEIAHRNVDAQISRMDDKVFQQTGKASPAQMEKWEKAAREKAQRDSDERMQHAGKVHIGGGKYLDQSELDAIARARLQPTLDDISEKAERQRARDEEERLERERKQAQAERDKARAAETAAQVKAESERQKQEARVEKEEQRKLKKDEEAAEKAKRTEERRLQKEQEAADKDRKKQETFAEKERARLEKEDKRKSKESKPGRISALLGRGGGAAAAGTGAAAVAEVAHDEPSATAPAEGNTFHDQVTLPHSESVSPVVKQLEPAAASPADTQIATSTAGRKSVERPKSSEQRRSLDDGEVDGSASPSQSRVKSWMKGRFRSKSNVQKENEQRVENSAALDKGKTVKHDEPMPRPDSMRDVAMAGRQEGHETSDMYGTGKDGSPEKAPRHANDEGRSPSISSLSSQHSKEYQPPTKFALGTTEKADAADGDGRGRTGIKRRLLKKIKPAKDKPQDEPAAPGVSNTTDDDFEEARDNFEEHTLAPPPPLSALTGEGSGGKPRSPKGSRERSRFVEQL